MDRWNDTRQMIEYWSSSLGLQEAVKRRFVQLVVSTGDRMLDIPNEIAVNAIQSLCFKSFKAASPLLAEQFRYYSTTTRTSAIRPKNTIRTAE